MRKKNHKLQELLSKKYPYGFSSKIDMEYMRKGLSQEVIGKISRNKKEPKWLLEWRLEAYRNWKKMSPPKWSNLNISPIDYQGISYYAAPKKRGLNSLEELDAETKNTFERLGIPISEQKRIVGVAMDLIIDSSSVVTTFKKQLIKNGVIFCSFSEAVQKYPDLIKQYIGSVVSKEDNYFAALNSAVFSDGSFCYIPKNVRCPMELSTYFRINAANTGQFERTLIIAKKGSYVSYLEGCSAPMSKKHQLHAAVVEIYAEEDAQVRYSTVQNWYPGDEQGRGGVYNFVTKRGLCAGSHSHISWTQVETGSAVTWKYPSCILKGDNSVGEFYSVSITKGKQQVDTGSKMIHLGRGSKSRIISKGVSLGGGKNTYRGLVKVVASAQGARNYSRCDSILIGKNCSAFAIPYIDVSNQSAIVEHEATASRVGEEQLFYCQQRGLCEQDAISLIVLGSCQEVLSHLPMEFSLEARKLLEMNLEGCVV